MIDNKDNVTDTASGRSLPWFESLAQRPLSIAHRGASHYAADNSASAFEIAAELDADLWEVDIRITRDGVCVCQHDPVVLDRDGQHHAIDQLDSTAIRNLRLDPWQPPVLDLQQLIDLVRFHDAGLYLDIKNANAVPTLIPALLDSGLHKVIVAASDTATVRALRLQRNPYPLAVLVPPMADPFDLAERSGASIIHLCWEHTTPAPQSLLTEQLLRRAREQQLQIVLWHEERSEVLEDLLRLPVLGICSNRPEMLKPYRPAIEAPISVLAHRGALTLAPENTLAAFDSAFAQGFDYAEFDIRTTADNILVLMHDARLERTTDGVGLLAEKNLDELLKLDAGRWFSAHFQNQRIPTLDQFLELVTASSVRLFVEIKQADAGAVLAAIKRFELLDRCFFWSADPAVVQQIKEHEARAVIMTRRRDFASLESAMQAFAAGVIEFEVADVLESELHQCRQAGVQTMIAYRGSDEQIMRKLLQLCPDIVNLDYPHNFKKVYRSVYPDRTPDRADHG